MMRMNIASSDRGRTPARRGSALLIVIGILALIAVLGAIYTSIGQSDTRSASAVQRHVQVTEIQQNVADTIAHTIAFDRLDTVFVPSTSSTGGFNTQLEYREAMDYPYTDWSLRSVKTGGVQDWELFSPRGGNGVTSSTFGVPSDQDHRVASDPWLSSTEPEYLGPLWWEYTGASPVRTFSQNNPEYFWLDNRDWRQISNLADDGRFVNLWNLRPEGGGFDAEPGVGFNGTKPRMTANLTLYEPRDPNNQESPLRAVDPYNDGKVWVPGSPDRISIGLSGLELLNTPAAWTMYQRYAFVPLNQPFFVFNPDGSTIADWSSPYFPAYQWADADGDGMADSRWCELINASDPNNIIRLNDDPDYRVFFAARVMDLSALVNVNTAGDQLTVPTAEWPVGLTPTEVDLRRLLMMTDFAQNYRGKKLNAKSPGTPAARGSGLTLENLDQPPMPKGANVTQDLGGDPAAIYLPPTVIWQPAIGFYAQLPDPTAALTDTEVTSIYPGELLGALTYDAMHVSIDRRMQIDDRFFAKPEQSLGTIPLLKDDFRLDPRSPFWFGKPQGNQNRYDKFLADSQIDDRQERRWDYWDQVARLDVTRSIERGADPKDFGGGVFDLTDLAELLVYRGINDPEQFTRLERASIGLLENGATETRNSSRRLSPLLANRPLYLDRFGHGDGRVRGNGSNSVFPDPRGQIDDESMALFTLSPRLRITTVSGGVQLQPWIASGALTTKEIAATIHTEDAADGAFANPNALFKALARSLAPYSGVEARAQGNSALPATWVDDMRDVDPVNASNAFSLHRTLNYGYNSAEQSVLIAGHLALNAASMASGDGVHAATILLDESMRNQLDDEKNITDANAQDRVFHWWYAGGRLDANEGDPNTNRLPNRGLTDERRQARNLFSVTAQPFLAEAAVLTVFTDAPKAAGGDDDYLTLSAKKKQALNDGVFRVGPSGPPGRPDDGPSTGPGGVDISSIPNITISTSVPAFVPYVGGGTGAYGTNPDLALQVIAFKLTNPFDEGITLNGSITWSEDDHRWENWDYYIEYNGRFFLLADFLEFDDAIADEARTAGGAGTDDGNDITDRNDAVPIDRQLRPIGIGAGQTRTVYVLADNEVGPDEKARPNHYDFHLLDQHWRDLGATEGRDTKNDATGPAWEWVNRQLRIQGGGTPARLKEFNPETGLLLAAQGDPEADTGAWRDLTTAPANGYEVPATERNPDRVKSNVVRLWRRMQAPGEGFNKTTNPDEVNLVENDLLADRLSAPLGTDPLKVTSPISRTNDQVNSTISFQYSTATGDDSLDVAVNACQMSQVYDSTTETVRRNDNTGWTIGLWGTIRRPDGDDPRETGQLPAWLIEVRDPAVSGATLSSGATVPGSTNGNLALRWDDDDILKRLAHQDFDASAFATICSGAGFKDYRTAIQFRPDFEFQQRFTDFAGLNRRERVVYTLGLAPGQPADVSDPAAGDSRADVKFKLGQKRGINIANAKIEFDTTTTDNDLEPELFAPAGGLENSRQIPTARPADLLLALGVGPEQAPYPDRKPGDHYDVDAEWLTLSEMLSIALGYEQPEGDDPSYDQTDDAMVAEHIDDPYVGMVNNWSDIDGNGSTGDPTDWRYTLPNLRLTLDDFVPFFDTHSNAGAFDGRFTPELLAGAGNGDVRAGVGIPMALDAVGRLRLYEGIEPLDAPDDWELTRFVPGIINVNTAPLAVLRMLPGLTPSLDQYDEDGDPTTPGGKQDYWLAQHDLNTNDGLPNLRGVGADQARSRPDIAATIAAYRDRTAPQWRRFSDPNWDGNDLPNITSVQLRYDPVDVQQATGALDAPADAAKLGERVAENLTSDMGRENTTAIRGLRETPGFASSGELLAVTLAKKNPQDFANITDTNNQNIADYAHNAIQSIGLDGKRVSLVNVGSGELASFETDTYDDGKEADEIVDDMGERTAIANGVLGSLSVSSDIYAVWFVVNGYRRSDVADLLPGDPLVPSYARRFLMVIDRSNVTTESDMPRVLVFKELPL